MDKLISFLAVAAVVFAGPALADEYPISGTLSTGLASNVAQFRTIENADPGYTRGTLAASVRYAPIDPLTLTGSMALFKNLDPGQAGQGTVGATTYGKTQVQDIGLDVNYVIGTLGPASFSTGVGFAIPLSENSEAIGLITAISPRVGVDFKLPATFSIGLTANAGVNVLEEATQRIDCTQARYRDVCAVSGSDTGNPNQLWNYGAGLTVSAAPVRGLTLSAGYSIGAGTGAATFENDEFTPQIDGIQDDTQYGSATHATNFGVSYSLSGLLPGAPKVEEGETPPPPSTEPRPLWSGLSFSLSLSTRDLVYARDRSDGVRITAPVFDFETETNERSVLSFGVNYSI